LAVLGAFLIPDFFGFSTFKICVHTQAESALDQSQEGWKLVESVFSCMQARCKKPQQVAIYTKKMRKCGYLWDPE